jgi:hypothetical protein
MTYEEIFTNIYIGLVVSSEKLRNIDEKECRDEVYARCLERAKHATEIYFANL